MISNRIPAMAAAFVIGAASLAPSVALAQTPPAAAPPAPVQSAPVAPPPAAAPGAPTAAAPGAPAAAPGTPDANAPPAGAPPAAAPDATATPPATADAGAPATEEVANPYGPKALWKNGDVVARGTLILLAIMSLGTWYIMITKFIEQARVFAPAGLPRAISG